jgi:magnesium-protoporphyrin IX monomethyl ester (oxidative) cyclase
MFRWFEKWCNDEFRHGEVFALLMKADPSLTRGVNKLWIRFFVLAVFATMYVRDHTRPELHEALGFDPTEYDMQVLRLTSTITRQIFPLTLCLDDPAFRARLDRLVRIGRASAAARAAGGPVNLLRRLAYGIAGAATFARLYVMRAEPNEVPADVRVAPVW